MTAVQEIQAAIEKLTDLRDSAPYIEMNGWLAEERPGASGAIDDPGYEGITNDPLIVTLHRTIDAQLDILRLASAFFGAGITGPESATAFGDTALALARAINGPTQ